MTAAKMTAVCVSLRCKRGDGQAFIRRLLGYNGKRCVIWPFGMRTPKYGSVYWGGRRRLVHRLVCELKHGPPPFPKAEAAHSCGVHGCCNWAHLRWADRSSNVRDRIKHGTHNRGERCGKAKLTKTDVAAIRSDQRSSRVVAAEYGIAHSQVSRIRSGKQWVNYVE